MYLARELTGESLPAIGRQFGGRDHTTVLHAWRRTAARIADDEAAREAVEKLRRHARLEHASAQRHAPRPAVPERLPPSPSTAPSTSSRTRFTSTPRQIHISTAPTTYYSILDMSS